jgi:hypothetical protein
MVFSVLARPSFSELPLLISINADVDVGWKRGREKRRGLCYSLHVSNHGDGNCLSLGRSSKVCDKRRQLSPYIGLHNLLSALRTDAGGHRFNHDELALEPKVLIDSLLLHLLAADVALTVVIALCFVVHVLFPRVRRYEEQLASFFDSTNNRGLAFIRGYADYLISSAPRVALESSADSARGDNHFDIGEKQIVVCHLLKEVGDCKFIFTIPYLLSDNIDNNQSRLFLSSRRKSLLSNSRVQLATNVHSCSLMHLRLARKQSLCSSYCHFKGLAGGLAWCPVASDLPLTDGLAS